MVTSDPLLTVLARVTVAAVAVLAVAETVIVLELGGLKVSASVPERVKVKTGEEVPAV
jgi:hypothetical protein